MRSIVGVFGLCCLLAPAPALAQSRSYVSALAAGDIVRGTSFKSEVPFPTSSPDSDSSGGEALALLLRAGTSIGERWGVEVELGFGGSIEHVVSHDFGPIIALLPDGVNLSPGTTLPPSFFSVDLKTEESRSTITAAVWARRPLGERAGLTFLGGLVFSRVRAEESFGFQGNLLALSIAPTHQEVTSYGAGPMAGIETDIRLTRRLALSAGVRIHTDSATDLAWVIRPAVGLRLGF